MSNLPKSCTPLSEGGHGAMTNGWRSAQIAECQRIASRNSYCQRGRGPDPLEPLLDGHPAREPEGAASTKRSPNGARHQAQYKRALRTNQELIGQILKPPADPRTFPAP